MKDEQVKMLVQQRLNAELSGLHMSAIQRDRLYESTMGGSFVKRKVTAGWVLAMVLILFTVTAVAAVLLTHVEIIEEFAVPLALRNDADDFRQEAYSHDELVHLVQTLNENGITLDEGSTIMKALRSGKGYWEEEVLMEICREAFGGNFSNWTVEEKYWFESMTVRIGFKENNPYLVPGDGDMTVDEARAHAAQLLKAEYGAELPAHSDDTWKIWEWYYAPWTDMDGFHPAMWKFEYVNRESGMVEYFVDFLRDGTLTDCGESGFHGEVTEVPNFSMAEVVMKSKYGSLPDWPVEAWAEYAELIAPLEPETPAQWCYQHAGYRLPPEGAITGEEAVRIATEAVGIDGDITEDLICCTDGGCPIYKVTLSIHFFGNETAASYDAVWCVELDCMTGEITGRQEYVYGGPPLMMYVPFSVVDAVPDFTVGQTAEEQARTAEKQRQADAYQAYEEAFDGMWYFWPLEAQRDALGGFHHVPQGEEMTREAAVELALAAIRDCYGQAALDALGEYSVGAICQCMQEKDGVRIAWQVYVTGDPVFLSNGYRVTFDDPAGIQKLPEPLVESANAENG